MNVYDLLLFVHIAAAVALMSGSVVASPAVRAAVRRARTTQEMRAYLAIGRPLLVLEPASAIIVLATGIYLTSVDNFWSLGWVQVAIAGWLVNAAVAGAMVKPAISDVAAHLATQPDGSVTEHLDTLRRSARWSVGGDLLLANDACMLYLMTMKPGLADSLLVVAAVNGVVAGARVLGTIYRQAGVATARASGGESAQQTSAAIMPEAPQK
jgi:uncharacterized membrane protein